MKENLNKKVEKTATSWKERAKHDRINRQKINRAQIFALELMDYMDAHNLKQKDLAERMNVSPQQINKILHAKENLTFETTDRIAEALGVRIDPPKIVESTPTYSQKLQTIVQEFCKHIRKSIEVDIWTTAIVRENPILYTTMKSMEVYEFTAEKI